MANCGFSVANCDVSGADSCRLVQNADFAVSLKPLDFVVFGAGVSASGLRLQNRRSRVRVLLPLPVFLRVSGRVPLRLAPIVTGL